MPNDVSSCQDRRIVAVGLLTSSEVTMFGAQLSRLYPLDPGSSFEDLLEAIDRADRKTRLRANAGSAERS